MCTFFMFVFLFACLLFFFRFMFYFFLLMSLFPFCRFLFKIFESSTFVIILHCSLILSQPHDPHQTPVRKY